MSQVRLQCRRARGSGLASLAESLYTDGGLSDLLLFPASGRPLQAHRMVLAAASDKMKALFEGIDGSTATGQARQVCLWLPTASSTTLAYLLRFVYLGEVQLPRRGVKAFIRAAEELEIMGLEYEGASHYDTTRDEDVDLEDEQFPYFDHEEGDEDEMPLAAAKSSSNRRYSTKKNRDLQAVVKLEKAEFEDELDIDEEELDQAEPQDWAEEADVNEEDEDCEMGIDFEVVGDGGEGPSGSRATGSKMEPYSASESPYLQKKIRIGEEARKRSLLRASKNAPAFEDTDEALEKEGIGSLQSIEVIGSQKGRHMLTSGGYTYNLHEVAGRTPQKISWRCSNFFQHGEKKVTRCRGKFQTRRNYLSSGVGVLSAEHNHPPDPAEVARKKAMSDLRNAAVMHFDLAPKTIVDRVLAKVPEDVRHAMPKDETLKRIIRRMRSANNSSSYLAQTSLVADKCWSSQRPDLENVEKTGKAYAQKYREGGYIPNPNPRKRQRTRPKLPLDATSEISQEGDAADVAVMPPSGMFHAQAQAEFDRFLEGGSEDPVAGQDA